jgi:translation initiation factor 2 subunit 2
MAQLTQLTQLELIERAVNLLQKEKFDDNDYINIPIIERGWKNRRTIIYNFVDICKSLRLNDNHKSEHLKQFIDFKTTMKSTIDSSGKLLIVGRVEKNIFGDYINTYVKHFICCPTCESANSLIEKIGRNVFISCNKCNSKKVIIGYNNFKELNLV